MNRRNAPLRIVVARTGRHIQLDCGHKGERRRVHYRARCQACMLIALTPELFLAS